MGAEGIGSDCASTIKKERGCSVGNLLLTPKAPAFKIREEEKSSASSISITEKLTSVKVKHDNQELLIERIPLNRDETCPPFCIQPMNIEGVKSVGEVETLMFIEALKEKKPQLLIDVRKSTLYKQSTIPGAISLPSTMLQDDNRYQSKVLKLLGAKKNANKWYFKTSLTLLIFANGPTDNQASSAIKSLIKLGYPKEKLLYYRGGVESWKRLGLTLY